MIGRGKIRCFWYRGRWVENKGTPSEGSVVPYIFGLQSAVPAEAVATGETRPLPHYWVFEQPQHSELDEGEVARLAVVVEAVATHCHARLWKHA